jgi:hypothetical protein
MTERADARTRSSAGPPTEVVGEIWSAVLGAESLDSDVGFFDLGATSADVAAAVDRLRRWWPDLRVVDVFLYPTVNSLTAFLARDLPP